MMPQIAPFVRDRAYRMVNLQLGIAIVFMGAGAVVFSRRGHTDAVVAVLVGLVLMGAGVFQLVVALRVRMDPMRSVLLKELARHGPLDAVSLEIEQEFKNDKDTTRFSNLVVTPRWLLVTSMGVLEAVRIDDVVWAYRKTTAYKVNGVKMASGDGIVLHTSAGCFSGKTPFECALLAREVDILLPLLAERVPTARFGFDESDAS